MTNLRLKNFGSFICLNIVDDDDTDIPILVEKSQKKNKIIHSLCRLFINYNVSLNYRNIKKPSSQLYIRFGAGKILYSSNDTILNLKL